MEYYLDCHSCTYEPFLLLFYSNLFTFFQIARCIEKKGKSRAQKRARKNPRDVKGTGKGKSTAIAAESSSAKAGSRCSNKYFGEKISKLDERKRNIIRDHGFGILLEYDGCSVSRNFVQWIADQVDVNCCDIIVGGKVTLFLQNQFTYS